MSKINWPESVPQLKPENICIGPYYRDKSCGCLAYWKLQVIKDYQGMAEFDRQLYDILGQVVTYRSDVGKITCKQVADAWNEAWERLGYTETIYVEE